MSVASLGALALDAALSTALAGARTSAERSGAVRGLCASWHKTLAKVNEPAWLIATGEDFRYKKLDGEGRFLSRLPSRCAGDTI